MANTMDRSAAEPANTAGSPETLVPPASMTGAAVNAASSISTGIAVATIGAGNGTTSKKPIPTSTVPAGASLLRTAAAEGVTVTLYNENSDPIRMTAVEMTTTMAATLV